MNMDNNINFIPPKRVIEPQPCDKIMNFLQFELYNKHNRTNEFEKIDNNKCLIDKDDTNEFKPN